MLFRIVTLDPDSGAVPSEIPGQARDDELLRRPPLKGAFSFAEKH